MTCHFFMYTHMKFCAKRFNIFEYHCLGYGLYLTAEWSFFKMLAWFGFWNTNDFVHVMQIDDFVHVMQIDDFVHVMQIDGGSFQLLLPPLGRCHLFVLNHLSDLNFHWVGYQPRIWTILQKMSRPCARTKVFWFGWQCIRGSNASRWRWFFWMPFGSSEQNEGWSYQPVDWKDLKSTKG